MSPMSQLKKWYDAAAMSQKIFTFPQGEFIIYKGFKVTRFNTTVPTFIIEDTRYTNMYSTPVKDDLEVLTTLGFIHGADKLCYQKDLRRVQRYTRRCEKFYDKRKVFKAELPNNKRLNDKRIRNLNKNIRYYIDLVFLHQYRVDQYEKKYIKE